MTMDSKSLEAQESELLTRVIFGVFVDHFCWAHFGVHFNFRPRLKVHILASSDSCTSMVNTSLPEVIKVTTAVPPLVSRQFYIPGVKRHV